MFDSYLLGSYFKTPFVNLDAVQRSLEQTFWNSMPHSPHSTFEPMNTSDLSSIDLFLFVCVYLALKPTVDLYLIYEKSIWKIKFNELDFQSILNLIITACVACKINFEIDFCTLKIQFVKLDFSNLIFQNSSTDQQGDWPRINSISP